MLTLKEAAQKELEAFFEANTEAPKSIRIFLAPGGCCGPSLSLMLDEATDEDIKEEIAGMTFCISPALYEKIGEVTIDFTYMGFAMSSERPAADPSQSCCSSCGGGCHH